MTAASVAVRGEARVPVRPDGVRVSLAVEALRAEPEAALGDAARAAEALAGVLDRRSVPAAKRVSTGVRVDEENEWDDGRYVRRGFRATSRILVTLDDPAGAGPLVADAVREADARVQGPWWIVAPDNPGRLEACGLAAAEAARKAAAYAGSLGLRLGAVVEVREPGVGRSDRWSGEQPVMLASAGPESARGAHLDLDAGELEVAAAVEVTFALDPG